jgi:hypothetical protein
MTDDQAEKTMRELREDWGERTPQRIRLASRALESEAGSPERAAQIANETLPDGSLLGDSPDFVRAMYERAAELRDKTPPALDACGKPRPRDEEEALDQIRELQADPEFMKDLTDNARIGHKLALERWTNLFKLAYADE